MSKKKNPSKKERAARDLEEIRRKRTTATFRRDDILRYVSGSPRLEVSLPNGTKETRELRNLPLLIGRTDDCSLQLDYGSVSREHARILLQGEEYAVEDLDSTNGVFLNGVRIARGVLRHLDRIDIGEVSLVYLDRTAPEQNS